MLFLAGSGGAWNHLRGNDKTKSMQGLFTGIVKLTGSHCSAFFSVRAQVRAAIGQGYDIHFKCTRPTLQAHAPVSFLAIISTKALAPALQIPPRRCLKLHTKHVKVY